MAHCKMELELDHEQGENIDDHFDNAKPKLPECNSKTIFVSNLHYKLTGKRIYRFFKQFGDVTYVNMVKDHVKKSFRGIAFVTFKSEASVESVLKLSVQSKSALTLWGRVLKLRPQKKRKVNYYDYAVEVLPEEIGSLSTAQNANESASNDGGVLHINDLPDDVLLLLFSHFKFLHRIQLQRVCKKWQLLVAKSLLSVKQIRFDGYFSVSNSSRLQLNDEILENVLNLCGRNAVELNVSTTHHRLSCKAVDYMSKHCKSLKRVNLDKLNGSEVSFRQFAKAHTKIEELCISQSPLREECFWWLLKELSVLKCLSLQSCLNFNGNCFHMISPLLERLELSKCHKLKPNNLLKIAVKCPNLSALILTADTNSIQFEKVLPDFLAKTKNLKELVIAYPSHTTISKPSLEALASLNKLEIVHLQQMRLNPFESFVFRKLCSNNNNLRELRLASADSLTDESFLYLRKLKQLEVLELDCCTVTDATLTNISLYNQSLKRIAFTNLKISSNACMSILASCNMLESFSVRRSPNVSVEVVVSAISIAQTRSEGDPHLKLAIEDCNVRSSEVADIEKPPNLTLTCNMYEGGEYDYDDYSDYDYDPDDFDYNGYGYNSDDPSDLDFDQPDGYDEFDDLEFM